MTPYSEGLNKLIDIELVFASEQEQMLLKTTVADGISARAAICNSDLVARFPDVDFAECPLGIWGSIVVDDQPLKQGDRLEAYRQLNRNPRDARRALALLGRTMGKSS